MFVAWRSVRNLSFAVALAVGVAGCGLVQSDNKTDEQKRNDEQKTRDEVAKATERARPELQKAGQEMKEAAKTAAGQAKAAAQGLKEGWERGKSEKLNLNSANESELAALPGVTRRDARKIIAGRPYRDARELVERGILSDQQYTQIRDDVSAE